VLKCKRGQDFVRSVVPWEEIKWKEDRRISHYEQKQSEQLF
jgi:hypothetical protein